MGKRAPNNRLDGHAQEIRRLLSCLQKDWKNNALRSIGFHPNLKETAGQVPVVDVEFLKELRDSAEYHEELMNKRIGFLLTFGSISIAGALTAAARDKFVLAIIVLFLSAWPILFMRPSIERVYLKTCFLFAVLSECRDPLTKLLNLGFNNEQRTWRTGKDSLVDLGIRLPNILLATIALLILACGAMQLSLMGKADEKHETTESGGTVKS